MPPVSGDKQMDMVCGDDIIENTEAISFLGLIKPVMPAISVFVKIEEKLLSLASMGNVPDASGEIMSMSSRDNYERKNSAS
jgi:hypothetical protein